MSIPNVGKDAQYQAGRDFAPIVLPEETMERSTATVPGLVRFWRRYRANRLAVVSLIIFTLLVLMAIFAPSITPGTTPFTPYHPELLAVQYPPSFDHFPQFLFGATSQEHFSVLAQVTYAAGPTLTIGVVSALLASLIGITIGAISGYFGGWVDGLLMRITDVFVALPFLPLVIALIVVAALTEQDIRSFVILFSVAGWAGVARQVRSNFLTLRQQDYTEAAHAAGVGHWRIIFRHLLPNALTSVIVATTSNITSFIVAEATLEYTGISGLNKLTWGNIIARAYFDILLGTWWWIFFPGLFITITVLAVNFIGEGLRDALDVRGSVNF